MQLLISSGWRLFCVRVLQLDVDRLLVLTTSPFWHHQGLRQSMSKQGELLTGRDDLTKTVKAPMLRKHAMEMLLKGDIFLLNLYLK
mmetsp:Transcript_12516/g.17487  ORF Transcript_12516/g.17487 Transcript_12516/m.17487 type:complete len:86 (-) Transcript_12516:23-280(-)